MGTFGLIVLIVLGVLVLLVIIGVFSATSVGKLERERREKERNLPEPEFSLSATIIDKERAKIIEHDGGDCPTGAHSSTRERIEYKATFEMKNHLRWTLELTSQQFDSLTPGDSGTLVFTERRQKQHFVAFIRTK